MMENAARSRADAVFLDLEDACAPHEKPGARTKVVEALTSHDWSGKTVSVRINEVTSPFSFRDLVEVVSGAGRVLDCIMIPKVRNTGDVAVVDRALTQLEGELGLERGGLGIEVQIEDPQGLTNCDAIARESPRVETMIFGPADFSASMQVPSTSPGAPADELTGLISYVLARLAVAARAAGVQVIDGPYVRISDIEGFRRAAQLSASFGYDGKWVIHPSQIDACNEVFTPAQADVDKARAILDAYRHATDVDGSGAVMHDGEMIDEASRKIAAQVVARAEAAGLRRGSEGGK